MIISDEDSEEKIFDNYREAIDYSKKKDGYAVVNFKIKGCKYYIVTFE